MKLIVLIVGLVLGAGGGVLFSVNYPEYASKLAQKENDLIAEGRRQALEQVKAKLDGILTQAADAPAKTPGSSFMGAIGGAPANDRNEKMKALSDDLGAQLSQIKKK